MKKTVPSKASGGRGESKAAAPTGTPLSITAPDAARLTKTQAQRLSALSGIDVSELHEATIAQISEKLKWRIDPELLLFRRICGQVVKTDPATGIDYPVPFATVHVEDTDCSFLGLFPVESPWLWLFPIFCRREEIGTVQTDACGRFCVWVPRFEIDWILRWRFDRYCYWDVFRKPTLQDLIEHVQIPPLVEGPIPRPPGPGPDPAPDLRPEVLQRLEPLVGRSRMQKLLQVKHAVEFGQDTAGQQRALNQQAFMTPIPPPLPEGLQHSSQKESSKTLSRSLGLVGDVAGMAENFDPQRFIGPFLRCHYVLVSEWTSIVDVPDITFRVTQDVNGDGTEETIYEEGHFDVRWNAGPIPDVTLHASPIAVAAPTPADSPMCQPVNVPCETPAIVLAGLYPLHNLGGGAPPYLDQTTGYAQRPNRPHPHAFPLEIPPAGTLATAPFTGTLQLYGCNERPGATYYRLRYTHTPPGGVASATAVFHVPPWELWRWVGTPGHLQIRSVTSDADGWYEIIPDAEQWLPGNLLLNWPTGHPGLYQIHMQFANAAKAVIAGSETPPIGIYVDNTSPTALITEIRWRVQGETGWNIHPALNRVCAVVPRPANTALEFRVTYLASALHLRNARLSASGCGGGTPVELAPAGWSDPASAAVNASGISLSPYEHWHTGPLDNTVSRSAIFALAAGAPQGAYDYSLVVNSRAFNPAGGDGGFGAADWFYNPVYIYADDYWKFAVIDV